MKNNRNLIQVFLLAAAVALPWAAQAQLSYSFDRDGVTVSVSGYNTNAGLNVIIPATFGIFPVTGIAFGLLGSGAFDGSPITSVTIPSSVTDIEKGAFKDCKSLTNITFLGNAFALADPNEFTDDGVAASVVYYYYGTSGWGSTYGGLPTVELGAPNPPQIGKGSGGVGMVAGHFSFNFTGASNQTVVVEASTDIVNWHPVWTNTLSGTNATFSDPQSTNYPSRFYRAR